MRLALGRAARVFSAFLFTPPPPPHTHTLAPAGIPDLANAIVLAATQPLPQLKGRHEVVYIAAEDNIGGRDFAAAVQGAFGGAVPIKGALPRPDCSGLNCAKARELLGWAPKLTWRDYVDGEGRLLPK